MSLKEIVKNRFAGRWTVFFDSHCMPPAAMWSYGFCCHLAWVQEAMSPHLPRVFYLWKVQHSIC